MLCCVFSWRLGGVVGRGGFCQACSRKGFVEGELSLMLAPVTGCPVYQHPTLSFWTEVWGWVSGASCLCVMRVGG